MINSPIAVREIGNSQLSSNNSFARWLKYRQIPIAPKTTNTLTGVFERSKGKGLGRDGGLPAGSWLVAKEEAEV